MSESKMYTKIFLTPDHEVNSKRADLEFSLSKAISPMQVCDQIYKDSVQSHILSVLLM